MANLGNGSLEKIWNETQAWRAQSKSRSSLASHYQHNYELWKDRGFPSRQDESFKYTSVNSLVDSSWVLANRPATLSHILLKTKLWNGLKAAELVFIDGQFAPELSEFSNNHLHFVTPSFIPAGQSIDLMSDVSEQISKSSSLCKETPNSFLYLNQALSTDGVFFKISESVELPIVFTFVNTQNQRAVSFPQVNGVLAASARASIVENYVNLGGEEYWVCGNSKILVSQNAQLSLVQVQSLHGTASLIGNTQIIQKRDSRVESLQISLGARLCRQDLVVHLAGEGAEAQVDGLYLAGESQHVDHHTAIEHALGNTASNQLYKGILGGEARAVFNGRIHIFKDAQKANAAQLNNNLMLSSKAEVDTKPELEIYADDVKAAHGATVGQLEGDEVFYFQSRAIEKNTALKILAHGFAQDVVLRSTNSDLYAPLSEMIANKLDDLRVVIS